MSTEDRETSQIDLANPEQEEKEEVTTSKLDETYSASIIANWFISQDSKLKDDVMKTLKLVYIAHGFYLALENKPLIAEGIQAWQYGPVIPELYFQLKADCMMIDPKDKERFNKDKELHEFLEIIYDKYKNFSAFQLSNLTHKKGTPWDITVNQFKSKINNELIKNHYKNILG